MLTYQDDAAPAQINTSILFSACHIAMRKEVTADHEQLGVYVQRSVQSLLRWSDPSLLSSALQHLASTVNKRAERASSCDEGPTDARRLGLAARLDRADAVVDCRGERGRVA